MTDAYPLAWPDGWPRTKVADQKDGSSSFKRPGRGKNGWAAPWTFAEARDALVEEVWRHNPKPFVLSSNFPAGKNGPLGSGRRPEDQAIAIYFQRAGTPYVMACDRYGDAEGNMRSLTLALEALRQLERHGGGAMLERAFAGFVALPAPLKWWEILGVSPSATLDQVQRAFRRLSAERHPDRPGGSHDAMAELTRARDDAHRAINQ